MSLHAQVPLFVSIEISQKKIYPKPEQIMINHLVLCNFSLLPDIDECDLENTCDKDAQCINTDGGYECRCSPGGDCSSACFVGGKKKKHGSSWDGDGCETCSCLVSMVSLDGKFH